MIAIKWVEAGMPSGVPFVLSREIYVDLYGGLEPAVNAAARAVTMAVEHYRQQCGATEAEYLEIEDYSGDLWPVTCLSMSGELIYVALVARNPGLLRAGAKVRMI